MMDTRTTLRDSHQCEQGCRRGFSIFIIVMIASRSLSKAYISLFAKPFPMNASCIACASFLYSDGSSEMTAISGQEKISAHVNSICYRCRHCAKAWHFRVGLFIGKFGYWAFIAHDWRFCVLARNEFAAQFCEQPVPPRAMYVSFFHLFKHNFGALRRVTLVVKEH